MKHDIDIYNRPAVAAACMKHKALVDERQKPVRMEGSYLPNVKITGPVRLAYRFENGQFIKNV